MAKAGRFACIFVPMFLTIVCLIFMIMIGLGGTNKNNTYLSNLYFTRINMTGATSNPVFNNNPANEFTDPADRTEAGKILIKNFYSISLWNYCAGNGDNATASKLAFGQQNTTQAVDFCTGRTLQWSFIPSQVWGTSAAKQKDIFGDNMDTILVNYTYKISKWMSTLYIMASIAIALEIIVGIGGLFSRLGSLFTTISALIAFGLTFSFSLLTTVTYFSMTTVANYELQKLGISFEIGRTIFIYMWLSVACSLVGMLFWAFSSCCCSGRERAPAKQMETRTPYTYERVNDAPFGATQTVHAQRAGGYQQIHGN